MKSDECETVDLSKSVVANVKVSVGQVQQPDFDRVMSLLDPILKLPYAERRDATLRLYAANTLSVSPGRKIVFPHPDDFAANCCPDGAECLMARYVVTDQMKHGARLWLLSVGRSSLVVTYCPFCGSPEFRLDRGE